MFRRSLDATAKSQNPLESMLSGDFDSFSQITNTVEYVNEHGITSGNQLLGVLFFWVPRSIWPDKAIDTGTVLGEFKAYFFKNLSAPLWAESISTAGGRFWSSACWRWDSSLESLVNALKPRLPGLATPALSHASFLFTY